jgi:hypothetical protein
MLYDRLLDNGEMSDNAKKVIEAPISKELIKKRSAGFGKDLNYISGSTVIDLLNKAFNYRWSFVIKDMTIVQSEPSKKGAQPPYMQVLGQLIVPELGVVKEQYGTKIILGGATEQEGVAKAAATDALKKCATLLGIGLELYEDEATPAPNNNRTQAVAAEATIVPWDTNDTTKLKELKAILDIVDNAHLNPYVREFLNSADGTYKDITPLNIKPFNKFLQKKAEEV